MGIQIEGFKMGNDLIVSRMNIYLHTSVTMLAEWLGKLLPRTSDESWSTVLWQN